MDDIAFKLIWLSQWKLQHESGLLEPTLRKVIGHTSVYEKATQYMQEHDVSETTYGSVCLVIDEGQAEDIVLGSGDEAMTEDLFKDLQTYTPKSTSTRRTQPWIQDPVVVTEVEVDGDVEDGDPFADNQEVSSSDECDDWSDSNEADKDSDTSVEENNVDSAGTIRVEAKT